MNEQLKILFESEVLNAESKQAIQEGIAALQEEAYTKAKGELEVEFAKKFQDEKQAISEGLNTKIETRIKSELEELVEDVEYYRNLEVDYAKKLEEFKAEYAEQMDVAIQEHLENIVDEEFAELEGQLEEARKLNFGKRLFEAFQNEFSEFGVSEDVKEVKARLAKSETALAEAKKELEGIEREKIMEGLLVNLKGKNREVMRTILENCPISKMEERYLEVIKDVISVDDKKDDKKIIKESVDVVDSIDSRLDDLRRLSGVRKV